MTHSKRCLTWEGEFPYFISRYYPADFKAIVKTFHVLRDYNFDIIKYIKAVLDNNVTDLSSGSPIRKLVFSLYLLSYYKTGQPIKSEIDFIAFCAEAKKRAEAVRKILDSKELFVAEFKSFEKSNIYSQKRTCCAPITYCNQDDLSA